MHKEGPYYLHCASKCTVCIVLIMCFKLKSIKSTLGGWARCSSVEQGRAVAAQDKELSTKDTCHLESHWVEKCTAAAEQHLWLELNATFQTKAGWTDLDVFK